MMVCMLTSGHHPTASARIFHREAKSLRKNGYNVVIIGPKTREIHRETVINGIKIIPVPRCGAVFFRPFVLFFLLLKGLKVGADVYHCHEPDALMIGVLIKIFKAKKLIYDVHEHWPSLISTKFPKRLCLLIELLVDALERIFCKSVDAVITVSSSLNERYQRMGKNSIVLYNVPPVNLFRPNKVDMLLNRKYRKYKVLLHTGYMNRKRGLQKLLQALSEIKKTVTNVRFIQIGKIREDEVFMMWMRNYIEEKDLKNNIEIIERVPHDKMVYYINSADVGLKLSQPTNYNEQISLPNKLFEYMACGKPVVTNSSIEIERIKKEVDFGFLVDPTNPEKIAEAIIYLLKNPKKSKEKGHAGRKAIEKKYNWEEMERRLLKLYMSLVNGK